MCTFVDHGEHGTGETAGDRPAARARPRRGTAPTTSPCLDAALAQLPEHERGQVLVRADTGACSKAFLHHITDAGLEYSIGFPARDGPSRPRSRRSPSRRGGPRSTVTASPVTGAQVAELTAWMPTPTKPTRSPARFGPQDWPTGMRVIARRERPHPGAQLRLTDHNGWRITCFATNTKGPGWTLAALEVRHRQRARCEDRIRGLKDTGLRNLPFHGYAQNRIWVEVVALAADLLAWTQTLAFDRARTRPPVGTQTAPVPDPRRRRTHHPHRPPKTPPTPPGLALEPPHRHRLAHASAPPDPPNPTRRPGPGEPATPAPGAHHARHPRPSPSPITTPISQATRNIEARAVLVPG